MRTPPREGESSPDLARDFSSRVGHIHFGKPMGRSAGSLGEVTRGPRGARGGSGAPGEGKGASRAANSSLLPREMDHGA